MEHSAVRARVRYTGLGEGEMAATYATTRHSLHGLAELVLAGPRYKAGGSMRLRAGSGGIRTWDDPPVLLSRGDLVSGTQRVAVSGLTFGAAAAAVGLTAQPLDHVYHDGPHVTEGELIELDLDDVAVVEDALGRGDAALSAFSPTTEPILWPEHFDVAITVDDVNHGVSPGDGYHDLPYAYVGPHQVPTGSFWNAPFGASRPLTDLPDVAAVAAFFVQGAREASAG
jgi:hypothetical protein